MTSPHRRGQKYTTSIDAGPPNPCDPSCPLTKPIAAPHVLAMGDTSRSEQTALVRALQAGDERAFEQLVREHMARMLQVARRLLRNEEDAREAVQDAFVSAYRSIGSFSAEARLSTWLHRITVNAALMKIRSRSRRPEVSIEELLPRFLEDGHIERPSGQWPSPASDLERKDRQEFVRDAIDRLPENYRNVILLRDIEELTTAEAAESLGLTENAVKVRLHRARQALMSLLETRFA